MGVPMQKAEPYSLFQNDQADIDMLQILRLTFEVSEREFLEAKILKARFQKRNKSDYRISACRHEFKAVYLTISTGQGGSACKKAFP